MNPTATRRMMAGTATPALIDPGATVIRSHDMNQLGLASATRRLNANVADLDIVFVARARSDLRWCPLCPAPHPAA